MKGWVGLDEVRLHVNIGAYAEERLQPQEIVVSCAYYLELEKAVARDALECTIDYQTILEGFKVVAARREYNLIETLATELIDILWDNPLVLGVRIKVCKPNALPLVRAAFVELERLR